MIFIKNVGVKARPRAHAQCTNALNVIAFTMWRVYVIAVLTCRVCNHGLEIKMSEPVPPVGLKSNGGTRPRYLVEYFAPSFKIKKKAFVLSEFIKTSQHYGFFMKFSR